jgi:glycine betaine/proline transport system ATP-binding protein
MRGDTPLIELRNVSKVFGADAGSSRRPLWNGPKSRSKAAAFQSEMLTALHTQGLGKTQMSERFGCTVAVADVSFEVWPGEIFCIMGLSGSGKSTLVRHINRLIEPTSGQILIEGVPIRSLDDKALRAFRARKTAMVFRDTALMPHRTVRDNVAMGLEIQGMSKARRWDVAERLLELVQLTGWEDRFPAELQAGQHQRAGLARAFATDPDIVLLDEPFAGLDPLVHRRLQDAFLELSRRLKKTMVFITNDLDEAIRLGNRIAIMKDGRILQIGRPEEIAARPADDYVKEFVRGISKLTLVQAGSIMQPMAGAAEHGARPELGPLVPAHATLLDLIDISLVAGRPIIVTDDGKRPVGFISTTDLLKAVQGGSSSHGH